MKCYQCGADVEEGMLFCTYCGAPLIRNVTQSSQPAPESVEIDFEGTAVLEPEMDFESTAVLNEQPVMANSFDQPSQPAYEQPVMANSFDQPSQPAYEQPVMANSFDQPGQPVNEQPVVANIYEQPVQPQYTAPAQNYSRPEQQYPAAGGSYPGASNGKVGFGKAIGLFFKNYVNFKGRASKSEYWWAFLFQGIVLMVAALIHPVVMYIVNFALLLPNLSVTVRRLQDSGKKWNYIFMGLIPIAGAVLMIIQCCKDSEGDNQWGPAV